MKEPSRRRRALLLSLTMLASFILPFFSIREAAIPVSAVSTDYPPQLMNIATKDSSKVLTENGTTDGSSFSVKALGNDLSSSWRFDRVGSDSKGTFFKLTNAESGRLLTPKGYKVTAGTDVILYGSESAKSQHWYVIPVDKDRLGNNLHYKIVNYEDTSLALTQGSSGMTLASARAGRVDAEKAAEFSFLMSAPLIAGGAVLELLKSAPEAPAAAETGWGLTIYGAAVAAVVGYLSLKLLVKALKGRWFWLFGPYCIVAGLLTLVFA